MNHSECGSKTTCNDWEERKERGDCQRCMFRIPNSSSIKFESEEEWVESLNTLQGVRDELKKKYPHGHPKFIDLILDEIKLHSEKNFDYSAGGDPLGNFNRVGAILDLYPGLKPGDPIVVAVTFLLKQLDASLWMLSQDYSAKVEGHAERWRDVAVYAKIISILIEERVMGDCGPYAV
jgi:hypothetical protein